MEILPNNIYNMDCIEGMQSIPDNSIDAIVTDPPYELGFMGKSWDKSGIANNIELWKEALRILKPGGHLLAFSGTRTYHRMASAIEDAGFEVRDMIEWVYGSGFPKSLNVAKAITGFQKTGNGGSGGIRKAGMGEDYKMVEQEDKSKGKMFDPDAKKDEYVLKLTEEAKQWEGWGTALKPSHEPICMARKPLAEKTVAENCLKWGTGGINIDESRVGTEERFNTPAKAGKDTFNCSPGSGTEYQGTTAIGRFPANLILEDCEEIRECFPETGEAGNVRETDGITAGNSIFGIGDLGKRNPKIEGDNGGNASRFFKSIIYIPKASKSERNKGCEELDGEVRFASQNESGKMMPTKLNEPHKIKGNAHPTVKPIALMEYLINMITREGQIILDPFLGSGTTAVACIQTNRQYIGFELLPEYFQIAQKRIDKAIEDSNTLFINYSKNSSSSN